MAPVRPTSGQAGLQANNNIKPQKGYKGTKNFQKADPNQRGVSNSVARKGQPVSYDGSVYYKNQDGAIVRNGNMAKYTPPTTGAAGAQPANGVDGYKSSGAYNNGTTAMKGATNQVATTGAPVTTTEGGKQYMYSKNEDGAIVRQQLDTMA